MQSSESPSPRNKKKLSAGGDSKKKVTILEEPVELKPIERQHVEEKKSILKEEVKYDD